MTSKNISNALLRTLFILAGIVFLGYIIGVISSVLLYVIVAILLSFVAQPISDFLQKKLRFPPILAIIVSLTLFIVLAFGILLLFVPLIVSQSKNLALLDMVALEKNSVLFINQVDVWLQTYDIQYKKLIDIQKITQSFNIKFDNWFHRKFWNGYFFDIFYMFLLIERSKTNYNKFTCCFTCEPQMAHFSFAFAYKKYAI
jgi:predicted PurR-regulated permease PerM